jgi:dolichyl-phosphate-mannose--protein O-mannosyl transferase
MSETFFDEIYYVRTAENYLKLQQPYEWTHPPVGKLIIAFGILVFGYSPFGWRIMGVVFATFMIPLIYLLGRKLFGTWIGAFAPAFLLTFDFMHFTMSRMATVDTFVVFFSLASQLFFLIYVKEVLENGWESSTLPLFLTVLFFALSFSTKWIALFGLAGQLAILLALKLRKAIKLKDGLLWVRINAFVDRQDDWLRVRVNALFNRPFFLLFMFLMLAMFVYFLTYIPDMLAGSTLTYIFQLQGYMFAFHSGLEVTHPFASRWWTWPLILRPLWLYASYLPGYVVSTIVLMGNPAVWWVGFMFVILAVEEAIRRKNLPCAFITVLFFFQWVPYVFISRDTFIYHFYSNVPFLCLASAYFLNKYWSRRWGKIAALAYFFGVIGLFWLFYPAISGMPAPTTRIDSLKWLGSWEF